MLQDLSCPGAVFAVFAKLSEETFTVATTCPMMRTITQLK